MKRLIVITIILLSGVTSGFSQQIKRTLYNEKVYLSTDKDIYSIRDTVRVKGFVTDSWENRSDSVSRYVYIELIDYSNEVLQRRKIKRDSLGFATSFVFDTTIVVGNYYLRGYTQPMKYINPEYIFTKQIIVDNSERFDNEIYFKGEVLSSDTVGYKIDFFVEGGNLVNGIPQRIVFKCTDGHGLPIYDKGLIVSSEGDIVATTETKYNGFGEFLIVSDPMQRYYYTNLKGDRFEIMLAKGNPSIRIVCHNNDIRYMIDGVKYECELMIHAHGLLIHTETINSKNCFGIVKVEELPSGVLCFTLFDKATGKEISERICYVYNPSDAYYGESITTNKDMFQPNETIGISTENIDTEGDYIVSVIKKSDINNPVLTSSLPVSFKLESDVKQKIINPNYFLRDTTNLAARQSILDMIMITEKWGRYVEDIKNYDYGFGREMNEAISGRVRNSKATQVSVYGKTLDDIYFTDVERDGSFYGKLPDFVGESDFYIQPISKKEKSIISTVEIRDDYFPEVINTLKRFSSIKLTLNATPEVIKEQKKNYEPKPINRYFSNEEGLRELLADEVFVVGMKKEDKPVERREFFSVNVLKEKDIERYSNFDISSAVSRLINVKVVRVSPNNGEFGSYKVVSGRGIQTLGSGGDPDAEKGEVDYGCEMGIMVDGVFMDATSALSFSPSQIESIERCTPAEAMTLAGSRGFCGLIRITTKSGAKSPENIVAKGGAVDKLGSYPNTIPTYNPRFVATPNLSELKYIISPRQSGDYIIRIEGISKNGKMYSAIKEITVR